LIPHLSERGLIVAPLGRDSEVASRVLSENGVRSKICLGLAGLLEELQKGAGFALVTEEALRTADLHPLARWIGEQPEWSDFPFVLLTQRGGGIERNPAALRFLETLGNVSFLERPFHPTSLVSLVRAALRGRRRQYEARSRLEALADLNATLEARVDAAIAARFKDQQRLAQAESALRQAQKLEAVGQLTGGVAHDFNNLLMAMSSGMYLIDQPLDAEQRRKVVNGMRQAVDRGTSLTRQLLAFSRRRPLAPKTVDLRAQLLGMDEMLHRSLRGDIDVKMSFDDGLWAVDLDPNELELAILNICVNSRDAMPDGGTIEISVRNGAGTLASDSADTVTITITDSGAGMSGETQSRAFEPFFTTKEIGRGSGLGLAQVYGFVGQSNGRASIASERGKGTTVTLVFPRSDYPLTPVEAQRAAPTAPMNGRAERRFRSRGQVLLVEDDLTVAALTKQMLEGVGLTVVHVKSAREALLELAGNRGIDVVFSDVMMPGGMSGVELAREVRARWPGLPVMLTTGYIEAARSAVAEGLEVLVKPYALETLVIALDTHLPEDGAAGSAASQRAPSARVRAPRA
jgi:signal transduction histidine kinase/ActR/RegA family two-component response regulator